ncbi:MAG: T9SS type A sorting domain-containing protein [Cytophagaceae bacterium]|jgi:PKD repeat protein|nr:T9SS type A sorting domain-containing protein [Cytophagaceae bacterium]
MKRKYLLSTIILSTAFLLWGNIVRAAVKTVTITLESTGITGNSYDGGAERTWEQDGISFGAKAILAGSGGSMQSQANNGVLYNTTPFSGRIVSIEITSTGTPRNSNCFGGTDTRLVNNVAANYDVTGGTQVGETSTTGWTEADFNETSYTYFAIKRGSNAAYWTSVVITYDDSGTGDTPAIAVSPASLNFAEIKVGVTSFSQSITVAGSNLTADIAYAKSGDDAAAFTVAEDAAWTAAAGGMLNVTFAPIEAKEYSAAITFTSAGADDKTVTLTGTGVEQVLPEAAFSADKTNVAAGSVIQFADESTGNQTAWAWTFEGGTPTTSDVQNPTVTYSVAGNYDVSLTVTNADGSDTETKTDFITVGNRSLTITNPQNGDTKYSPDVSVTFAVEYFAIPADGKIKYVLDGGQALYHESTAAIALTELALGSHTIALELVDTQNNPLTPAIAQSVTFTIAEAAVYTYVPVNSMDELINGGKYLITGVKGDELHALSFQQTNNRRTATVQLSGNNIVTAVAMDGDDQTSPYEITLAQNGDNWTLFDAVNGTYLRSALSGSGNYLQGNAEMIDWTIAVENGVATMMCVFESHTDRNNLRFNSGNNPPVFACYSSGQTDVKLYRLATEPSMVIVSPENNAAVDSENIEIELAVNNFELGENAGKIKYTLNGGTPAYTTSTTFAVNGLVAGENTITVELVNNDNSSLNPAVSETLTLFLQRAGIEITSPANGENFVASSVSIVFEVSDFELGVDGKVKYALDGGEATYVTASPISLAGLSYGTHTVTLELVDMDNASLLPAVTASVTFILRETEAITYTLVTSADDLADGGDYLFVGTKNNIHYALGWQKQYNRHAVPVTVIDNTITVNPATEITPTQDEVDPYQITMLKNGDQWSLLDGVNGKYLIPREGDSNGLLLSEAEALWNISFTDDSATFSCTDATYSRGAMRFNRNNNNPPLFACYQPSASQDKFFIYKSEKSTDTPSLIVQSPSNNQEILETNIDVKFLVRNFVLGTDGKVKYTFDSNSSATTVETTISLTNLTVGAHTIVLELVDMNEAPLNPAVAVTVNFTVITSQTLTIAQIQEPDGNSTDSPYINTIVETTGVVTARLGNQGFYIQDGTGAWSGIYVYTGASDNNPEIGYEVKVYGYVKEYYGLTEITSNAASPQVDVVITVISEDAELADAAEVSTLDVNNEQYESVLVKITNAEVKSGPSGATNDYVVNDGSGDLIVSGRIFAPSEAYSLTVGNHYSITGVVDYYNAFKVMPRESWDVIQESSINFTDWNNGVEVSPNPFADAIYYSNVANLARITVTNLVGQTVLDTAPQASNRIDTGSLPKGIYLVVFHNKDGKTIVKKMVKR